MWSGSASHRIEYMQGVTGAVTQVGHRTIHDGIAIAGSIKWCTGTGCIVQWHVEECGHTGCYAVADDVAQWVLGALPSRRLMDTTCTIGCSPPRIDEDTVEHLGTPCLVETRLRWGYQ